MFEMLFNNNNINIKYLYSAYMFPRYGGKIWTGSRLVSMWFQRMKTM